MAKEWKPIEGLEGYEISNTGDVRCWRPRGAGLWENVKEPRQVSLCKTKTSDYLYLKATISGRFYQKSVHREVAKAFIPNPKNLPCVNHKDENKQNNSVDNLEWCTHEYNMKYSFATPCQAISPEGLVETFDSVVDFATKVGCNRATASRFLRGIKYKTCKGWRRVDE